MVHIQTWQKIEQAFKFQLSICCSRLLVDEHNRKDKLSLKKSLNFTVINL